MVSAFNIPKCLSFSFSQMFRRFSSSIPSGAFFSTFSFSGRHICRSINSINISWLYILIVCIRISNIFNIFISPMYMRWSIFTCDFVNLYFCCISWWFFTGVCVTPSLLESPGLFSVFWPFSIMLSFSSIIAIININGESESPGKKTLFISLKVCSFAACYIFQIFMIFLKLSFLDNWYIFWHSIIQVCRNISLAFLLSVHTMATFSALL